MNIRPVTSNDRAEWLRMLFGLYPDTEESDHVPGIETYLSGGKTDELTPAVVFVLERSSGGLGGFVEVSVRDYAEGCTGRAPYLESWYVDEDLRKSGAGRALIQTAENWAREHGYTELASDALLDNHVSHAAHEALGFEVVERSVHYRKSLEL